MVGKTREERKMAALLRAQLSLKHACERIDHAEDVIRPQLESMRELAKTQRLAIEVSPEDVGETT
jgi:hypothetical protein